ncbi:MAG: hypothetical protein AAF633_02600 [Chloroflexota bacterium]
MKDETIRRGLREKLRRSQNAYTLPPTFVLYPFAFILLITLLLYAPTIAHPAMYDTLLHTQLAEDLTLRSVWLPNERFGFYRPLVFLPFVLMEQTGGYQPWLLHLLNIGQHLINVALVYSLVKRLWPSRWQLNSLITASLFATFPFAYQALAIYGNNAYLTVTGVILWGLHVTVSDSRWPVSGVRRGMTNNGVTDDRGRGLGFLSEMGWKLPIIFLIGVMIHETAVLLFPLALFVSFAVFLGRHPSAQQVRLKPDLKSGTQPSRSSLFSLPPSAFIRSFLLHHTPFILLTFAYLAIYFFLPRGAGPSLDYGGNATWPKLLLFMQTAAYPLVFFLNQLINGTTAIILGFAITILAAALKLYSSFQNQHRKLPSLSLFSFLFSLFSSPVFFALVWILLSLSLIGITLPTYYIEDGARLLYPSGVGAALLWGAILQITVRRMMDDSRFFSPSSVIQYTVILVLLITTLSSSIWFTRRMVGLYDMLAGSVWGLANDEGSGEIVIVNFPQWVSWPEQAFPVGTEFAPLLGDHLFVSELTRANFGWEPTVVNLHVPELLANTPYAYGLYGVNAVAELPITTELTRPQVILQQSFLEDGPQTNQADIALIHPGSTITKVTFGAAQELTYFGQVTCYDPGENILNASLSFHVPNSLSPTWTLFVQALDQSGRVVGQLDGPLVGIPHNRVVIMPVEQGKVSFIDTRRIEIEPNVVPKQLIFGAYDFVTGERLLALEEGERRLKGDAAAYDIEACSDD